MDGRNELVAKDIGSAVKAQKITNLRGFGSEG